MQGNETEKEVEPTVFIMEFIIPGKRVSIPWASEKSSDYLLEMLFQRTGYGHLSSVIAHKTTEIKDKLKGCRAS